jgi:hypothetical protein
MSKDIMIKAYINPLLWMDASPPFEVEGLPSAQSALEYLSDRRMEEIKANYGKLVNTANRLGIVPAEARLLMKMIFPLKNAIGSYMLGNYVECIGICGYVAEMAALFVFEFSNVDFDNNPITNPEQEKAHSERIEKIQQGQRTDKLLTLKLIDDDTKIRFDCVAKKRNKYLHRLSANEKDIDIITKQVFESTLQILVSITGFKVGNGKAIFHQKVLDYLAKQEAKEKKSG